MATKIGTHHPASMGAKKCVVVDHRTQIRIPRLRQYKDRSDSIQSGPKILDSKSRKDTVRMPGRLPRLPISSREEKLEIWPTDKNLLAAEILLIIDANY